MIELRSYFNVCEYYKFILKGIWEFSILFFCWLVACEEENGVKELDEHQDFVEIESEEIEENYDILEDENLDDILNDKQADEVDFSPCEDAICDQANLSDGDEPEEEDFEEENDRQFRLVLQFSSPVIETAIEGGAVDVSCIYLDPMDNILPAPPDMEISVSASDSHVNGSMYSFDEMGEKIFRCSSSSLGLETTDSVIVAYEGMDRGAIRLTDYAHRVKGIIAGILHSADVDDLTSYTEGIENIESQVDSIRTEYFQDYSFFVYNPDGWPSRSQLTSAGFTPGTDDTLYLETLERIRNILVSLETTWTNLDPHDLNTSTLGSIVSNNADLKREVENISMLLPSEIGFMDSLPILTEIVGTRLAVVARIEGTKMAEVFRWYGLGGGGAGGSKMTLTEMVIDLAISEIIDALPSYEKLLKDAAKAAAASALMMIIAGLIDREWPAVPEGPVFESVHGSAMGFLLPGNTWIAVGTGFNNVTARNIAVFIPPAVGMGYVDTIDTIFSAGDGLLSDENILKRVKKWIEIIRTLIAQLNDDGISQHKVILYPTSVDAYGDPEFMYFGPCPEGVNPSMFPATGILIPVNLDVGRGPSILVNVLSG